MKGSLPTNYISLTTGKNATEAFDDVGHSPDAKEIQKKYLIGVVVGDKKKDTSSKSSQPVSR